MNSLIHLCGISKCAKITNIYCCEYCPQRSAANVHTHVCPHACTHDAFLGLLTLIMDGRADSQSFAC